ncbi:YheC/YheD family protein [Cytobacillus sp. FJAT-54145]|uniref:YheC/YheD family protein n=1 Tax=Cytobacillus spartinae TaxID=3299023 RepID=A0ABW6K977_9BACI
MTDKLIYSVVIDKELSPHEIHLHAETLKQLYMESNSIELNFGNLTKKLTIKVDHTLKINQIKLPSYLNETISIPNLPYVCFFKEDLLFLGPVIGFKLSFYEYTHFQNLLKLRFSNYDQIKGLLFIFNDQTINQQDKTITGFYYEPSTNQFIEGTFPYPGAIYSRSRMKPETYSHFKEHIGENIFNYPYENYNKYTFWTKLSKIPYIREHLPVTSEYTGVDSLLDMLAKYESVFVKPTSLSRGKGIFHIAKVNDGYMLSDNNGKKTPINSEKMLAKVFPSKIQKNKQYIVQQEIPFYHFGKKIDFRLYLQKDCTKNWKYSGMETKVANVGSVVSNSTYREKMMPGEVALKEIYRLNEDEIKLKIAELTKLGSNVLNVIEKIDRAHFGDVAIDLVLDKECKIWLLEVQVNYAADRKALRSVDERQVLPSILPTPFEYAKVLAGFNMSE